MVRIHSIPRIFPLIFHVRRMIGAPDKGEIALLGDEDYPLAKAWCVQRVTGRETQRATFDLPKLQGLVFVEVLPHQNPVPDLAERSRPESDKKGRSSVDGPEWFLLAKGHSRVVESCIRFEYCPLGEQPGRSPFVFRPRREEPGRFQFVFRPLGEEPGRFQFVFRPSTQQPGRSPVVLALRLGDERQARGSGENVLSEAAAAALGSAFPDMYKAVYAELGSHIRALTDVRFRLLTLVPTISGLALTILLTQPVRESSPFVVFLASFFGLGVTLGIRIYDVRNSQLYDDLISRARSLEALLGIERGPYMRRSRGLWPIQHDVGLFVVYFLVLSAWFMTALFSLAVAVYQAFSN